MQVAITADVHLTEQSRHPERYQALEKIFTAAHEREINDLIIAGDLFDASQRNYAEFDALCSQDEHSGLSLTVIPGNHDAQLDGSHFIAENVRVINEPAIVAVAEGGRPFFFVPYMQEMTMGEAIAPFAAKLPPNEWVLIGHGDWVGGRHASNPYEPGVYMPLTRSDIERFQPSAVFLGHIHSPITRPPLYYTGSPCGLNVTETGHRRFLLYDALSHEVISHQIDVPVLYFDETFVVVPADDEEAFMREQINERIASWKLQPGEESKVRVRVRVSGYSADKKALAGVIKEEFNDYRFYQDAEPDLSEVYISDDLELATIAKQVQGEIETLEWPQSPGEPTRDEIMLDALHVIYGS